MASPSQIAEAERQLLAGVQRHPENLNLLIPLADLRDFQGRYDEVEQVYGKILQENPDNIRALNNLSWLIAMRGQNSAKAISYIERAVDYAEKLVGPVPELLDTRATIYLKVGKNREALRDLEQAVNLASETAPTTYFHLAQAYLANGNKAEAQRIFEKAESLTAKDFHPLEREIFEQTVKALQTR